jgi:succinate-semialdehyde dehydrogenase/glutarate-semialdehyde dehydrogenase
MNDLHRLFIAGAWREGATGATRAVINPATEETIGRVADATGGDLDAAIQAARGAVADWRTTPPDRRAVVLNGAADYIVEHLDTAALGLTREQGKTLIESRAEFGRVVETLRWHASAVRHATEPRRDGDQSGVITPEPIGIVAAFTPWNYPAVIAARKIAAALTAGCAVILKGAEEVPSAVVVIVRALEAAGLPPGVVNLVFGDPSTISGHLLDSPAVQAFSFTGSTPVGKQLAERAARTLKRCVLELGGHAPVLIFEDADLDAAVRAVTAYKFECAGQSCNAPSRIYVAASLYERFVAQFSRMATALRVGDGSDPSTDMGPMANPRRLAAMQRLVDDTLARGGRVVTGGARLARPGYFWPPTIVLDVPDTAALMSEEAFGPVVPVLPFATFDEVVARANENPYGLAAYVFTRSAQTAEAAGRALAVGSIGINSLAGVPPDVGIAGIKDSGYGYEGGRLGIDAFLNLKVIRRGNN